MKFITGNIWPICIILFLITSELTYIDALQIDWLTHKGYTYSLGDCLYFLNNRLGYVGLLPVILLYNSTKRLDGKGLYMGIIFWNAWEVLQDINTTFRLGVNVLSKVDNEKMTIIQIIFIILTTSLIYYGFRKWKLSSP